MLIEFGTTTYTWLILVRKKVKVNSAQNRPRKTKIELGRKFVLNVSGASDARLGFCSF